MRRHTRHAATAAAAPSASGCSHSSSIAAVSSPTSATNAAGSAYSTTGAHGSTSAAPSAGHRFQSRRHRGGGAGGGGSAAAGTQHPPQQQQQKTTRDRNTAHPRRHGGGGSVGDTAPAARVAGAATAESASQAPPQLRSRRARRSGSARSAGSTDTGDVVTAAQQQQRQRPQHQHQGPSGRGRGRRDAVRRTTPAGVAAVAAAPPPAAAAAVAAGQSAASRGPSSAGDVEDGHATTTTTASSAVAVEVGSGDAEPAAHVGHPHSSVDVPRPSPRAAKKNARRQRRALHPVERVHADPGAAATAVAAAAAPPSSSSSAHTGAAHATAATVAELASLTSPQVSAAEMCLAEFACTTASVGDVTAPAAAAATAVAAAVVEVEAPSAPLSPPHPLPPRHRSDEDEQLSRRGLRLGAEPFRPAACGTGIIAPTGDNGGSAHAVSPASLPSRGIATPAVTPPIPSQSTPASAPSPAEASGGGGGGASVFPLAPTEAPAPAAGVDRAVVAPAVRRSALTVTNTATGVRLSPNTATTPSGSPTVTWSGYGDGLGGVGGGHTGVGAGPHTRTGSSSTSSVSAPASGGGAGARLGVLRSAGAVDDVVVREFPQTPYPAVPRAAQLHQPWPASSQQRGTPSITTAVGVLSVTLGHSDTNAGSASRSESSSVGSAHLSLHGSTPLSRPLPAHSLPRPMRSPPLLEQSDLDRIRHNRVAVSDIIAKDETTLVDTLFADVDVFEDDESELDGEEGLCSSSRGGGGGGGAAAAAGSGAWTTMAASTQQHHHQHQPSSLSSITSGDCASPVAASPTDTRTPQSAGQLHGSGSISTGIARGLVAVKQVPSLPVYGGGYWHRPGPSSTSATSRRRHGGGDARGGIAAAVTANLGSGPSSRSAHATPTHRHRTFSASCASVASTMSLIDPTQPLASGTAYERLGGDGDDEWEMNSSAYADSLDEAQIQWIEEQLRATENPVGFF